MANYCTSCRGDFGSVRDFDAHRIGTHQYLYRFDRLDGRRCLDASELVAEGFNLSTRGRWTRSALAATESEN